jgi:hypothetical protein
MPAAVSLSSFREMEQRLPRLRQLNVALLLGLVFLAAGLSWDAARWVLQARQAVEPVQPGLADLRVVLPAIPSLTLPEDLFAQPPVAPRPPPSVAAVAEGAGWKLKGVLMGGTQRAMLEDAEKKSTVWVTEGQQVGPWKVLRIEERLVLLEKDGVAHEIRM